MKNDACENEIHSRKSPILSSPHVQVSAMVLGIIINESFDESLISLDKSATSNLVVLTYVPMACLIGMAYQSNLLAFLVRERREAPVDTFQAKRPFIFSLLLKFISAR